MTRLSLRRQEFRDFTWNHAEDAFQARFDVCAMLSADEATALAELLRPVHFRDESKFARRVRDYVEGHKRRLRKLLQLTGLTRNKIVQDIKAFVRSKAIRTAVTSPEAIFRSSTGVELGATYLAQQALRVFGHLRAAPTPDFFEAVNQAT